MKKNIIIILITFFSCILFISCNKYEDGPAISLTKPEKRIVGTHNLEKMIVNDKEVDLSDMGIEKEIVTYNKNGSGERISKLFNFPEVVSTIEWEFDNKKEHIRERTMGLNGEWGSWTPYYRILRLTKDELWIVDSNSVEPVESHYKKQ